MLFSSLYFLCTSLIQQINIFHIQRESCTLILFRIFTGFIGVILQLYMYQILPLSIATMIFYIYPGIMSFICYLRLNERLSFFDYFSLILSFIGLCLISTKKEGGGSLTFNLFHILIPLGSAIFCAITDMCTKIIGIHYNYLVSPTFFSFACLFMCPIFIFSSNNEFHLIYLSAGFKYCILASIWGALGQNMVALALIYEKGGRFAAIQYLTVALSVLFDILFLGKTLSLS